MATPTVQPPASMPAAPDPERELLALCRARPEAGFAELHRRYLPQVWGLCLRVLGSRAWAEDACQECFIRIWSGLPAFREESRLGTWIWTVSHRCVTSLAIRENRGERRGNRRDEADTLQDSLVQPGPGIEKELERADLLHRLMRELGPAQRSVVTLFYMQELSVAEVSVITGLSEGAVRVTLHRARENRELLPAPTRSGFWLAVLCAATLLSLGLVAGGTQEGARLRRD